MSHAADPAYDQPSLRQRAVARLTPGSRPDLARTSTSEAMAVLYQLASSPSTAADALVLLHELQVHQVELDLQAEELRNSRIELEGALIRQTTLVERAPVGYMSVDDANLLREVNLAATHLLGANRDELRGRQLAGFLTPASADKLMTLLARVRENVVPESCKLDLLPVAGEVRQVLARAGQDSTPGHVLLVFMPLI